MTSTAREWKFILPGLGFRGVDLVRRNLSTGGAATKPARGSGRHRLRAAPRPAAAPGASSRSSSRTSRRQSQRGTIPKTPNKQSISRHQNGIPRTSPAISARGTTAAQAIIPHSITQRFRTGSRSGPTKSAAITRCAKASQSVP